MTGIERFSNPLSPIPNPDLTHIESWIFDLDNTLYPAECNLFREINARMAEYVRDLLGLELDAARVLQKDYYVRYGTTMSGLMREHGVDPDDFMAFVHDIDLSVVADDARLAARLKALPGRKFVFTNGSVRHADNVLTRLGCLDVFDEIFDIKAANYTPKPHRATYERFLETHAVEPEAAAMFEDIPHNLEAAHALGMTTVLVSSAADWIEGEPASKRPARAGETYDYVHHVTGDLAGFLGCATTCARPLGWQN